MNAEPVAPATLLELERVLAGAAANASGVGFVGGGTCAGFGYPPQRGELSVDVRRLDRIVDYQPADMVVEVEAGCTLAKLAAHLAPNHQRLALDPPSPERATIGGVIATNAFGPRRLRFGSVRDLIVGISLVRADGIRVRGGGKVVKNVAGFDLPKLAVGSLGTLGAIATATFRLHPVPQTDALLRTARVEADAVRALVRALTAERLEPSAVLAVRAAGAFDCYVLFEGFASAVAAQRVRFGALAAGLDLQAPVACDPGELARLDAGPRTSGALRARAAAPPAQLPALCSVLAEFETRCRDAWYVLHPALGIAFIATDEPDPDVARTALDGARARLEALGGHLVLTEASAAVRERVDVYGTPPASLSLMAELKARFDPERRLNRGRFVGAL